ncbi:MAG: sigma-54-dependent Fis family transcriptional regulator [Desulfobacterales bacterium]|nr:sigma-54-dependent Fis family transcriptional regulator [Desulfobacterales bacterium]
MEKRIIAVDDEPDFLESVKRGLITSGLRNIRTEGNSEKAASAFRRGERFDVALLDVTMPGLDGLELLEVIKNCSPDTECIMVTALDEARTAVDAMKKGAYDYLVKPVDKDDLILAIKRALERKKLFHIMDIGKGGRLPELSREEAFRPIVTTSPSVLKILKEAELHAADDAPVLITGESGTGKELLAAAVHLASPRADAVFTPVNMAAMTGSLFDAEFFGHTRGAFTGAGADRAGYLARTNKGTLFLDEIGSLPLELQGKLLRTLQGGEYIKLGTDAPRKIDVRFIAATNEDLEKRVAGGRFRKDLYYRLKGGWLHLPPLRERKEDIPLLVNHFLNEFMGEDRNAGVRERAMTMLLNYHYPGNIRELRSIIKSAVNLSEGGVISGRVLPDYIQKQKNVQRPPGISSAPEAPAPLAQMEKAYILKVYGQMKKNKSRTARVLNIALNTLRKKLKTYGAD